MNINKTLSSIFWAAGLAVLAIAGTMTVAAQGRYADRYSRADVNGIIERLENSSNNFRRDFDRYLDESQWNNTPQEQQWNRTVANFERSLNRLRRNFDTSDGWWQNRADVQDVMSNARPVNQMMLLLPFGRRIERQWTAMRRDINTLADTYDLPDIEGGGYGGEAPWQGGNVPNWAVGQFVGRNPNGYGQITLNVQSNGTVLVSFDGGIPSTAYMNGTRFRFGGSTARVSRLPNGIRTTSDLDGQSIDYFRTGIGGGYPDGPVYPGGGGNVPRWAVGTFYGRTASGTITLVINDSGNVDITYENGTRAYGVVNGSTLTIGGEVARIQQRGNGITTVNRSNGTRLDYTRDYQGGNTPGFPGGGGNVPQWAVGTFYGRTASGTITLVINDSGYVDITYENGTKATGVVNGSTLTIGSEVARIQQRGNGIRTVNRSNGTRLDYTRDYQGGNNPGFPGGGGNVPSWALGTFYGRSPNGQDRIQLTITRDGNVAISFNGGAPTYATLNGTTLRNGSNVARVSRLNNGIRTTSTLDGEAIDYYRNQY
jgi:hypothetical protein